MENVKLNNKRDKKLKKINKPNGLMKAIEIVEFGGPENLKLKQRNIPKLKKGEILIKVIFAGVNRPDILQREGNYPVPKTASDIPGLEVSGIVVDREKTASKYPVGSKICALCHGGGYAEYVAVNQDHCLPIPKKISLEEAACIPETFITVWSNVFLRGGLKKNESILIHGGASGIGTTAIQLAKIFGAKVYATAGSSKKCAAIKKLGAIECINYKKENFEKKIKKLTNGKGVNLILDMVAGDYVERNLKCLDEDGRLVIIAVQGGLKGNVNFGYIMRNRYTITGSTLRPQEDKIKASYIRSLIKHVWPFLEKRQITPVIQKCFGLTRVSFAHKALEKGDHIGKFVLKV